MYSDITFLQKEESCCSIAESANKSIVSCIRQTTLLQYKLVKGKTVQNGDTQRHRESQLVDSDSRRNLIENVLKDMNKEKFKPLNFKIQKSQSIPDFLLKNDWGIRRLGKFGFNLPQEVLAIEKLQLQPTNMTNATMKELKYSKMKDQIRKIDISVVLM